MIIEKLAINNSLRNFNYILGCEKTRQAVVIDPLNADLCLQRAQELSLNITAIINTHEHWDHIAGNTLIIEQTDAEVYAHKDNKHAIKELSKPLVGGETLEIGEYIALSVLDTPGHTHAHICLLSQEETPALFSGDTLFNAGCGNCRSGCVHKMYDTHEYLNSLPEHIRLFPGHDYLENNLNFSLSILPENKIAIELQEKIKSGNDGKVTSLATEKQISPFFQCESPTVLEYLQTKKLLTDGATKKDIFIALRALRDAW